MYHSKKEIKSSYGISNTIQREEKREVKINLFEYFCKTHDVIPSLCDTVVVLRISQYVKGLAKRDLLYFLGTTTTTTTTTTTNCYSTTITTAITTSTTTTTTTSTTIITIITNRMYRILNIQCSEG